MTLSGSKPNLLSTARLSYRAIGDDTAYNPREDDKIYAGTRLLDSIENQVIGGVKWWQEQSEDKEGIYDDMFRLVGGGAKNVATAIAYLPGIKQLGQLEDWVASQARDLSTTVAPELDPRFAGWMSRFLTGIATDKALGKAARLSARAALKRLPAKTAYAATKGLSPAGDIAEGVNHVRTLDKAMTGAQMARERILQDIGSIDSSRVGRAMSLSELEESGRFFTNRGLMRGQVYDHGTSAKSKAVMERLQTPQGDWIPAEFKNIKEELLPDFLEEFKPYMDARGLTEANVELHHIFFLTAAAPLYDGLRYMSPEWVQLTQTLWDLGQKPGSNPSNLLMTFRKKVSSKVGGLPEPHDLLHHRYMVDEIGGAGQKFFTTEMKDTIRGSQVGRLKAAAAYVKKMNRGKRFINDAMDQLRIAFGNKNIDPERLAHVLEFALDDGSLNIAGSRYALDSVSTQMKSIVADINWLTFLDSIETVKASNITTEGMLMLKARLAGTKPQTINRLRKQGYYNPNQIKLFELETDIILNRLTPAEYQRLMKRYNQFGKGSIKQ